MRRLETNSDKTLILKIGAALAILTLLLYSPTFEYPFIHFDDPEYVFENPHVQAGLSRDGLVYAFTTFDCANWHPLTWLSLELDATIFGGQKAGAFHATNVLLHIANGVLLFVAWARLSGQVWRSAMVAALFALHPLHVESVAWVGERKDVLCTFFWMLSLIAYTSYVRAPNIFRYLLVMLTVALGLLAKPMLVTAPLLFLLLDYWPLQRAGFDSGAVSWARLILEKAPLFLLTLASCVVTFVAQNLGQTVATFAKVPLDQRIWNALNSYVAYIANLVWPIKLAPFYPHPGSGVSPAWGLAAGALLLALTVLALALGRRWRYVAVGWLWYLASLVPVIGLVQVGDQALADRYTYVPAIGLFVLATWGISDWMLARRMTRVTMGIVAAVILFACTALTSRQLGYWKDDLTLWQHTIDATQGNWLAQYNLGAIYGKLHRPGDAVRAYQKALESKPDYLNAHHNLGAMLAALGRTDEAMAEYQKVLQIDPEFPSALYNLASLYRDRGEFDKAIAQYEKVIRASPDDPAPHAALGRVFERQGKLRAATRELGLALALDPRSGERQVLRHQAANTAVRAAAGQGQDAEQLTEAERSALRTQALECLKADLATCNRILIRGSTSEGTQALGVLEKERQDAAFTPVRDPAELAKLPETERQAWQSFWSELEAILRMQRR